MTGCGRTLATVGVTAQSVVQLIGRVGTYYVIN